VSCFTVTRSSISLDFNLKTTVSEGVRSLLTRRARQAPRGALFKRFGNALKVTNPLLGAISRIEDRHWKTLCALS
jgi:hypothetical protein